MFVGMTRPVTTVTAGSDWNPWTSQESHRGSTHTSSSVKARMSADDSAMPRLRATELPGRGSAR
jgi:hypothetical protein